MSVSPVRLILSALLLLVVVFGAMYLSRAESAQPNREVDGAGESDELRQPLLQAFDDVLRKGEIEDVNDDELDESFRILREADSILTRIKAENRQALHRIEKKSKLYYRRCDCLDRKMKKEQKKCNNDENKKPDAEYDQPASA